MHILLPFWLVFLQQFYLFCQTISIALPWKLCSIFSSFVVLFVVSFITTLGHFRLKWIFISIFFEIGQLTVFFSSTNLFYIQISQLYKNVDWISISNACILDVCTILLFLEMCSIIFAAVIAKVLLHFIASIKSNREPSSLHLSQLLFSLITYTSVFVLSTWSLLDSSTLGASSLNFLILL